jgi:hypothetical protein
MAAGAPPFFFWAAALARLFWLLPHALSAGCEKASLDGDAHGRSDGIRPNCVSEFDNGLISIGC